MSANPTADDNGLSNEIYLGTYILVLSLQICCAAINALIILIFMKVPTLRKNKHLRLVSYLSVGDFLYAIGESPYIIYMILNWNPNQLDFNPLYILISSIPLPMQLKISATITIGIALSRNLAVWFPGSFRKLEPAIYSEVVVAIGIILALFDAALWFILSPPKRRPNCGTSGCFVSNEFRYYWVGIVELTGFSIFKLVGPFYSASVMASGGAAPKIELTQAPNGASKVPKSGISGPRKQSKVTPRFPRFPIGQNLN
ncbi:hypothetical protein B9Z55_017157 [Caenorhabditis nigoni]|uniref:G-protein coupled receptors family 1 profile domain-containing protein n=1 Tax=Caenorhabditis nigoni TaxID=1611254 RepID=A0A2G5T865_9PELO|nr:hypothetical protein B9Z55_017157 [Caenorhabditis nigoni]